MNLSFENFICYDDKLWFTDIETNEFYYYDLKEKETVFICEIAEELGYKQRLFGSIIQYDNSMYLIPFEAEYMYKVDLHTRTYKQIDIVDHKNERKGDVHYLKFLSAHICENKIYMIPVAYPAIVEFDCVTEEVAYYDGWVKFIDKYYLFDDAAFFRKSLLLDKKIYAPLCAGNAVMVFNIESKQSVFKVIGSKKCSFSGICQMGDNFWLSPRRNGPIVKWNEKSNISEEYSSSVCEEKRGIGFSDIFCFDNKLLIVPIMGKTLYEINCATGKVLYYINDLFQEYNDFDFTIYKKELYLSAIYAKCLMVINPINNKINYQNISLDDKYYEKRRKKKSFTYHVLHDFCTANERVLEDDYENALQEYIYYSQGKKSNKECQTTIGSGKNIYCKLIN